MMAREKISGIYVIVNTVNGKVYVGQAVDIHKRWINHKSKLNNSHHFNQSLQSAWIKYGASSFKFEVLENCSINQLSEREQFYINYYTEKDLCYNFAKDVRAFMRGVPRSEETRRRMSDAAKNRPTISDETRMRMSEAAKKRPPINEKTRQRLSVAGKNISKETRQKLSNASKGNAHSLGKKHSKETREKMSEAHKGKKTPPVKEETRRKISEANKGNTNRRGKHHTDEARHKLSEAGKGNSNHKGKSHSEEARQKMSEAAKRREATKRALRELPPDSDNLE